VPGNEFMTPFDLSSIDAFDEDGKPISKSTSMDLEDGATLPLIPGAFVIPAKGQRTFDLRATAAAVHPTSELGEHLARSEDKPQIRIETLTDLHGLDAVIDRTTEVPAYVLYQSRPLVTIEYGMDPLVEGVNTLFRMTIGTDPDHRLAYRQIFLDLTASAGLTITNDIPAFRVNGVDIPNGPFSSLYLQPGFGGSAILAFPDLDQIVSNEDADATPTTIELRATITNVTSGSHVITFLSQVPDDYIIKSRLVSTGPPGQLLLQSDAAPSIPPFTASFIWSDLAEKLEHIESFPTSEDYHSAYLLPGGAGVSLAVAP
jgi:hypothetical protein